ncbi:MAG: hypothetical protein PHU44_00185 [Syntrophales bacterium]|nr:hypothetical protein [Syntrophales bacterium]MDD5640119.1 hypothetical protein [Syntrophales bacterium]
MSIVDLISMEWGNMAEITAHSATASTTKARSGNYALRIVYMGWAQKTIPARSEVYLQFGYHADASHTAVFFSLRKGSTSLISIQRNASGYLELRSGWGGTLLGTGVTPTTHGQWYLIELHFRLADVDGVAELRLDGNTECIFAGDTKPDANTEFDNLYFNQIGASGAVYYDDVVVNDTNGLVNNSWPGGLKLVLLKPAAEGPIQEWTPTPGPEHYTAVDEVPPSGTDYVRANANDLTELFGLEDLPAEAQSVKAVALDFHGLKGSTIAPTRIAQITRVDGVDYVQADQDLPLAEGIVRKILDQNPAGGNWTVAAVNALISGIKTRP